MAASTVTTTTLVPEVTTTTAVDVTTSTSPVGETTTTALGQTTTTLDPNTTSSTTSTPTMVDPTTTSTTSPAPAPIPVARCSYVYRMQWPVLGGGAVLSVFGADRDLGARHHAGVDISAPKMTPVVAVRDGVIRSIEIGRGNCCLVSISHDDGWSSWYLHMNNDVDGSDDGAGVGIRPDLAPGTRVVAGEVVGWVGDSGNAEPTTPHLHFELHMPNGVAIDPLASLRWAFRRVPAPALEFGPARFSGPYIDDDGLPAEATFGLLASLGAISSCDSWSAAVCPHAEASILDAVGWISALSRVLVPIPTPTTSTEIVEQMIQEARNCGVEACPPPTVTAGQAASILLWAQDQRAHEDALAEIEDAIETDPALITSVALPPVPQPYWMADRTIALARLAERGMADDCPMASPASDQMLTRTGLAEMVAKAFGYLPVVNCGAMA